MVLIKVLDQPLKCKAKTNYFYHQITFEQVMCKNVYVDNFVFFQGNLDLWKGRGKSQFFFKILPTHVKKICREMSGKPTYQI